MQNSGEQARQITLIDLPASELLARFGAGAATPGSGSAAALMALLSASLVRAVAKMTVAKSKEPEACKRALLMINIIDTRIEPQLKRLFEEDSQIFHEVIEARKRRDDPKLASERRKNTTAASEHLNRATDGLFEIVELSFQILDNGAAIWDIGFQPAMGDAGAGISAALAAITTCLLVVNVNLRAARSSWSREAKLKCDDIHRRMADAQNKVFQLVRQSTEKTEATLALPAPPTLADQSAT